MASEVDLATPSNRFSSEPGGDGPGLVNVGLDYFGLGGPRVQNGFVYSPLESFMGPLCDPGENIHKVEHDSISIQSILVKRKWRFPLLSAGYKRFWKQAFKLTDVSRFKAVPSRVVMDSTTERFAEVLRGSNSLVGVGRFSTHVADLGFCRGLSLVRSNGSAAVHLIDEG